MKKIQTILLAGGISLLLAQDLYAFKQNAEAEAIYAREVREATAVKTKKHKKKEQQRYAGWYMRIKVSATAEDGTVYRHTSAGVFGKLKKSRYKKDINDIPAFGPAKLQVVFPHITGEKIAETTSATIADTRKEEPAKEWSIPSRSKTSTPSISPMLPST